MSVQNQAEYDLVLEKYLTEAMWLREVLIPKVLEGPHLVTFCHNDFHIGNLLLPENLAKHGQLMIIDCEFCGYNYAAFDISKFWREYCANYDQWPLVKLCPDSWPDREIRRKFLNEYLAAFSGTSKIMINRCDLECTSICLFIRHSFILALLSLDLLSDDLKNIPILAVSGLAELDQI